MLRLEVLCFAGTYGLALLSELARFVIRGAVRWYLTVGLTALGWLVQTAYPGQPGWSRTQGAGDDGVRVAAGAVVDHGLIGLYLMVRSPQAGGGGAVRAAAGAGPGAPGGHGSRRGRTGPSRGGATASGARCTGSSSGRGGDHVRGVCRRPDVPGPVDRLKHKRRPGSGLPCRAWSSRSGSTGGRSRWPSRC